jgi:hypothetical protein
MRIPVHADERSGGMPIAIQEAVAPESFPTGRFGSDIALLMSWRKVNGSGFPPRSCLAINR